MRLLLLALILLLSAGCTASPDVPRAVVAPPEPVEEPEEEPDPEVRLALVGDILLTPATTYRGIDWPWSGAALLLQQADLAIGNLETAVSLQGKPAGEKQFTFRSHPDTLKGAARAGIDVLTLANNHTLDYGVDALFDTMEHAQAAGIAPVGAGANAAEAAAPLVLEVNGLKVAILGFTRVLPFGHWAAGEEHPGLSAGWDSKVVLEAVRKARARADAVIVLVHWGEEVKELPRSADTDLARQMIDAGATVIAGHHAHILQGIERRGSSLVAYSLGNFIFPPVSRPLNQETGVLEVVIGRDGVRSARFTPLLIDGGQPRPPKATVARGILERLNRLSGTYQTTVAADGTISRK